MKGWWGSGCSPNLFLYILQLPLHDARHILGVSASSVKHKKWRRSKGNASAPYSGRHVETAMHLNELTAPVGRAGRPSVTVTW